MVLRAVMKPMNIWQRLNTGLMLLIVLLLVAVGLALWVESVRKTAEQHREHLKGAKDRIGYDILVMTDALRGLSLDPKNELEKKRRRDAESDLRSAFHEIQVAYPDFPQLGLRTKELNDFVGGTVPGTFGSFESRIMQMAESDPANASSYFNANYPGLSRQREQLLRELTQEIESATNTLAQGAQTVSIIGLTCLLLILLASFMVGRFQSAGIAEPLQRLIANLERMRQGDFSERLTLARGDEFGEVGHGLNRLADDLCELVGQVQRSGIQVNASATQIAATAKEQQSTAHEIAATTAQIGATSKQISATTKDLVRTMTEVTHVAEQTATLAGSGQSAIAKMEASMRQMIDACSVVTSKLAALSDKTTNINSVVTTITKVADQTNLLSLNAAIEAEKAGEYGLGFAVVAMEIRRLADQTAVATFDIEKMVKEMKTAVAAGVIGMDKFSEDVQRGVEEVRQVSTHLAQIIGQVQTLTPRFQSVNEGMHAQATGAQQISDTLTQLSEAARQTVESLRQSNLAIEQLNGAARGLHTSVARFKLSGHPEFFNDAHAPGL